MLDFCRRSVHVALRVYFFMKRCACRRHLSTEHQYSTMVRAKPMAITHTPTPTNQRTRRRSAHHTTKGAVHKQAHPSHSGPFRQYVVGLPTTTINSRFYHWHACVRGLTPVLCVSVDTRRASVGQRAHTPGLFALRRAQGQAERGAEGLAASNQLPTARRSLPPHHQVRTTSRSSSLELSRPATQRTVAAG